MSTWSCGSDTLAGFHSFLVDGEWDDGTVDRDDESAIAHSRVGGFLVSVCTGLK